VTVCAEPSVWCYAILVNNAEAPKGIMLWVVVAYRSGDRSASIPMREIKATDALGKGECVESLQPAMISVTTLLTGTLEELDRAARHVSRQVFRSY
jgi:hypothetical protein